MMKQREKSLRDYIRVNLRKVMAEAKSMERKEVEKQSKMDEREKEARYIYITTINAITKHY